MATGNLPQFKGYHIDKIIGSGGFGRVYKAQQTSVGREVAIKFIRPDVANDPEYIRRFESEAQLIARLEHPHIVPLIDYWRDPNGAYLVMRYLNGGSLRDILDQEGALELITIAHILDQLASALDFAHRQQVIHRDIKPGNILLDDDGNAYLADFNIAKDLTIQNPETNPDAIVGTHDYISPEQARSEPVTGRTDIYSLGVTLYELITGEHPFKQVSSRIERIFKHIQDPLPELPVRDGMAESVRLALDDVIQKATAKDPHYRFPDVHSMAIRYGKAIGEHDTEQALNIIEQLTMKEHEVLQLLATGLTNKEIADELFVTKDTVKFHLRNTYKKLGVRSRVQAIVRARELDLIITERTSDFVLSEQQHALSVSGITLPEPENPYKGLHAFQMNDNVDFFGREDLTQRLVQRLAENEIYNRFLAIVGPSGSGKSSLVRAGIIPHIWQGKLPGSEKWYVVDMIPGQRPLDELELALTRIAASQANNMHDHLKRDEYGLVRAAELILPKNDTQLLLIIDQFEELFTLVQDEGTRQHFLDLLYAAVNDKRSRVYVIVTLRADYYDRPLYYPQFAEMLRTRMDTVLPLTVKGLERAIRGPAERVNVIFEQALVEQIVSEMNYQAGALPLLQYALTELFDRREGRMLTHEAYQQIGGAVGALANRADDIYLSLTETGQELAQQLFMRLVTLGEGAEDTRRRATFAEILSLTDATDLMEEIIDQFAAYRLLSLDHDPETRQPTIEVAHEAILREWERLRVWLNQSREDIRLQQQITQLTEEWRDSQKDPSYLLRGLRLDQFERWSSKTQLMLNQSEQTFLQMSLAERQYQQESEANRKAREAAQEKRSQILLRALVLVFALAAIISIGVGSFALIQRNNAIEAQNIIADEQARTLEALDIAQRSSLAFAADAALEVGETDLSIALAIASAEGRASNLLPETQRILQRLSESGGPRRLYTGDVGCVGLTSIGYTYRLLVNCVSGNWTIIDLITMTEVVRQPAPTDVPLTLARISQDGQRILSSSSRFDTLSSEIDVWDGQTLAQISSITINNPVIWLSFGADSSTVATFETTQAIYEQSLIEGQRASRIGQVLVVRDTETTTIIKEYDFTLADAYLYAFAFSPDGTMGAVVGWAVSPDSDTYRIIIFDTETGDTLYTFDRPALHHPEGDVLGALPVGFSADSRIVWFSGYPSYAIEIATGDNYGYVHEMRAEQRMSDTGPSPNFTYIGMRAGEVRFLFNIETGEETLYQEFAAVNPSAVSNAVLPVLHGRFNEHILWDISGRDAQINHLETQGNYPHVSYSPDGTHMGVVTGFWRDTQNSQSIVYDAETLTEVFRLDTSLNIPYEWSWSPDGNYIATTTATEGVIIWDAQTGEELHRLQENNQEFIMQAHFTSDSRYLVSATGTMYVFDFEISPEPEILLWDTETWSITRRIPLPFDEAAPMYGIIDLAIHPDLPLLAVTVSHSLITENASVAVDSDTRSYIVNYETSAYQEIVPDGVFVIGNLKFTPDGNYLVAAEFADDDIYVVDVVSGEIVTQWVSPDNGTIGLDISPNSRYVVTGSGTVAFESNASVWDIQSGQLLQRYRGHLRGSHLMDVTFHPDGQSLATTAIDGNIYTYEFSPQSALDWLLENRVVRELTCAERVQYRITPPCDE